MLEAYTPPQGTTAIVEKHVQCSFEEGDLGGTFDLLLQKDRFAVLEDWKCTGVYSAQSGKQDWINQTNIYAYMINKCLGIKVDEIYINAILRDWMLSKQYAKGYPKIPFMRISIPVYDLDAVEQYIKQRIALHKAPSYEPCTDEERWTKETTYVIKKEGNPKAFAATYDTGRKDENGKSTRSAFYTYHDASEFLNNHKKCQGVSGLSIEERKGEDTRCKSYCPVRSICVFNRERDK
jgi:hypothetical protein